MNLRRADDETLASESEAALCKRRARAGNRWRRCWCKQVVRLTSWSIRSLYVSFCSRCGIFYPTSIVSRASIRHRASAAWPPVAISQRPFSGSFLAARLITPTLRPHQDTGRARRGCSDDPHRPRYPKTSSDETNSERVHLTPVHNHCLGKIRRYSASKSSLQRFRFAIWLCRQTNQHVIQHSS